MIIAIVLFVWILVILGFNYWDYKITLDGGKPEYFIYYFTRAFAAFAHAIFSLIALEPQITHYGSMNWWSLLMIWAPFVGYQVTSFWIVYEIVRNWWTGQYKISWHYYDNEEKDSGGVDRLFAWLGPTAHIIAKVLALLLMIFCILVIWTTY